MIRELAVYAVFGGVGAWCAYLVVKAQRAEARERRRAKLLRDARAAQALDLRWVDDNCPCTACGGQATRTRYNAETRQFACVDTELCALAITCENQLGQL